MGFFELLWYMITRVSPWLLGAILLVTAIVVVFMIESFIKAKGRE